jgi:hypothetical protein
MQPPVLNELRLRSSSTPSPRAGAPKLMSAEVQATLCDHAQGSPRALMNMAGELLALAASREARQIDEQLFFETFAAPSAQVKAAARRR